MTSTSNSIEQSYQGTFYAMITDSPITSSVTPSRVNSASCIDSDTDSISGTGYESVSFSFSGTFTAGDYYYIYITYLSGTSYQPYAFFTSSSFSASGSGSSVTYYYFRAIDTDGNYLTQEYSSGSPIYESYTGVSDNYSYVGYQRGTTTSNARQTYLSSGIRSSSSSYSPTSTYPCCVFVYEEIPQDFTVYYRTYDLNSSTSYSDYLNNYSTTMSEGERLYAPSISGYNYEGLSYGTSRSSAWNRTYYSTDSSILVNSSYPYIAFWYTPNKWQTPGTASKTINLSSYTNTTGSSSTSIYQYRAEYITINKPAQAGKFTFQSTNGSTSLDWYGRLTTATTSTAGSGTSLSGAISIDSSYVLDSDDDGAGSRNFLLSYTDNSTSSDTWYVYINGPYSSSGSYTCNFSWSWYVRYSVTYNNNGGSGSVGTQYFYGDNTNLTITTSKPTRTNYTFLGWSTNSSATNATYSSGTSYSLSKQNYTLYAVWKLNTVTLSYSANGGTGAPSSEQVTPNTSHNVNFNTVPTRTNYTFKGWSTSSTATTPTYKPGGTTTITISSNTTLYAVWWPVFNWNNTYTATQANILIGYILTYIGKSLSQVNAGDLWQAAWHNALAQALNSNLSVSRGSAATDEQLEALADEYNSY